MPFTESIKKEVSSLGYNLEPDKEKIVICEECRSDSDLVRLRFGVGDEKFLAPGTKIIQQKCKRCRRIMGANERMLVVIQSSK